jgi:hypothetical protein
MTLNRRAQGSSPCAPTNDFNNLGSWEGFLRTLPEFLQGAAAVEAVGGARSEVAEDGPWVLRSDETAPGYRRAVQPRPQLGRWKSELDGLLSSNADQPGRERLAVIRLFQELRGLGYGGGYDAVRRYA